MTPAITPELRERAGKDRPIPGEHYWITRKRLPGVVLCKWCCLTRSPATKARRCEPLPPPASPLATGEAA